MCLHELKDRIIEALLKQNWSLSARERKKVLYRECDYKQFYTHSRSLRYVVMEWMNEYVNERMKEWAWKWAKDAAVMDALSSHDYKIWKTCAPINVAKMNEYKMPNETAANINIGDNEKKESNTNTKTKQKNTHTRAM